MPTCCSVAASGLLSRAHRHTWRKKAFRRGDLSKVLLEATRDTSSSRSTAASAGASLERGRGSAIPIRVNSPVDRLVNVYSYHITRYKSGTGAARGGTPNVEPRAYTV